MFSRFLSFPSRYGRNKINHSVFATHEIPISETTRLSTNTSYSFRATQSQYKERAWTFGASPSRISLTIPSSLSGARGLLDTGKYQRNIYLLSIPQSGGKNVITFEWDHRLQRQNFLWHIIGVPDGSRIESTV